jgi:hypothetical protein
MTSLGCELPALRAYLTAQSATSSAELNGERIIVRPVRLTSDREFLVEQF